jgi:hypothetical protein
MNVTQRLRLQLPLELFHIWQIPIPLRIPVRGTFRIIASILPMPIVRAQRIIPLIPLLTLWPTRQPRMHLPQRAPVPRCALPSDRRDREGRLRGGIRVQDRRSVGCIQNIGLFQLPDGSAGCKVRCKDVVLRQALIC